MFTIEEKYLQAIGNYLLNQPYKDVALLIDMIKSCKKAEEGPEKPDDAVDL